MIRILNLTRAPLTLTIPHAFLCTEEECRCTRLSVAKPEHNPLTGDSSMRVRSQRVPFVATLWANSSEGGFRDEVAEAPEVMKALKQKRIAIELSGKPGELVVGELVVADSPTPSDSEPGFAGEEIVAAAEEAALADDSKGARKARNKER